MKLSKIVVAIILFLLMMACSCALIVPHGISGYVFELDGVTQVQGSMSFRINNTNNGFYLDGKTGRGSDPGKYVATVNGQDGDILVVRVWNDYHEASRTVVLSGVMYSVNLFINTTMPVHPPVFLSTPVTFAWEDQPYAYQAQAFDEDLDELEYSIRVSPAGLLINATSGLMRWLPTNADIGDNLVVVEVTDNVFAVNQSFIVKVQNVNDAPVITTTPMTLAVEGQPYLYDVNATDEDNDTLLYLLSAAPVGMTINSATGLISWTPTGAQVGNNNVKVIVGDGSLTAEQEFTVTVQNMNHAPKIVSYPTQTAVQDTPYFYDMQAHDEDHDPLLFSLASHPAGMAIGEQTGLITWTPTHGQVGLHNISLLVSDGLLTDEQNFTINVSNKNDLPVIASSPITSATEDVAYGYQVLATDPDNEVLSYALLVYPPSMAISSKTGLISWLPLNEDVGLHHITLAVSDEDGSTLQSYTLVVENVNDPPAIISSPPAIAVQDNPYIYQLKAIDPDHDILGYSLKQAPAGMEIDVSSGLVMWTPNALQVGNASVLIVATDGHLNDTQSFVIMVQNRNDPPLIVTSPILNATVGVQYFYDLNATDIDSDKLTYSLLESPLGMTINPISGIVTWMPRNRDVGEHVVAINVSDGRLSAIQTFKLQVFDANHCRRDCYRQFADCDNAAKEWYRQCKAAAILAFESCRCNTKSSFDNCMKQCRSVYFSSLRQCSTEVKARESTCSDSRVTCLTECAGKETALPVRAFIAEPVGTSVVSINAAASAAPNIKVAEIAQRPVTTSAISSAVYQYLSIEQTNLEDESIQGANITFYVEKSWLIANGIRATDVSLRRFHNGAWQTLPTRIVREEGSRVYYVALTNGFSYFAVAAIDDAKAALQPYTAHSSLGQPISVSGVLYLSDGKTQVARETKFVIVNERTNHTFDGLTGVDQFPGAFFVIVDALPGDSLLFRVEGEAQTRLKAKGDIDFASFIIKNSNQIVMEEPGQPTQESGAGKSKTSVGNKATIEKPKGLATGLIAMAGSNLQKHKADYMLVSIVAVLVVVLATHYLKRHIYNAK
jgi:PGF-pre-PGF domain-containing protein